MKLQYHFTWIGGIINLDDNSTIMKYGIDQNHFIKSNPESQNLKEMILPMMRGLALFI